MSGRGSGRGVGGMEDVVGVGGVGGDVMGMEGAQSAVLGTRVQGMLL